MSSLPPKLEHTGRTEFIIVPEGDQAGPYAGIYIKAGQLLTPKAERRLMEMVAGRQRVMGGALATRVIVTSEEQWAFAIGLVVCGFGQRMEL